MILGSLLHSSILPYPRHSRLSRILHGQSLSDGNISLIQADRFYHQLAMVNAASIPGRVVLNMLTPKFGVFNLVLFSAVAYAVVIFGLFGINNTAGVIVFALSTLR